MSKVKRITCPGYIVTLKQDATPLELCTEDGQTLTESSQLKGSRLLIGDSASVFSSRNRARAAITRTKRRAVKEGTFFSTQQFNIVRLIGVPA